MLQRNPRISLSGLALMFAIAGTALYIQLPIVGKPYFGLTVIALGAFCSSLIRRRFISIDELAVLGVSLVLLVVMIYKAAFSYSPVDHLYIFNLLLLPIAYLSVQGIANTDQIVRYIKLGFHITFVVFFAELVYRLLNPSFGGKIVDPGEVEGGSFYLFKISSLMYTNSNGVGMHAIFMLAFIFSLYGPSTTRNNEVLKKNKLSRGFFWYAFISLLFFTLGSLSRAAVGVFLLLSLLYFMFSSSARLRFAFSALFLLVVPLLFVLVPRVVELFASDGSFWTKFQILNNLVMYLQEASLIQILFGNNFDPPLSIYPGFVGYFGHAHYFDIVFRFGLFGGLIYLSLFFLVLAKLRWRGVLFVLGFIILGMSNIRIFGHYLFLYMGLLLALPSLLRRMERSGRDMLSR